MYSAKLTQQRQEKVTLLHVFFYYKRIIHLNSATIIQIQGCMLVQVVDMHCHCRTMFPVRKHPGF